MTDQSTDYNNPLVIYCAVKDLYADGNISSSGQMSDSLVVLRHISNDIMQLTSFMASLSDSFLPALHNPSWIQCSKKKKGIKSTTRQIYEVLSASNQAVWDTLNRTRSPGKKLQLIYGLKGFEEHAIHLLLFRLHTFIENQQSFCTQ